MRKKRTVFRRKTTEWLEQHVTHSGDECLPWPFAKCNGYGVATFDGKQIKAHRIMCAMAHGPAPDEGMLVRHICGNGHKGCVNPRHLAWGTRNENAADMVAHGRAKGAPKTMKPCRSCGAPVLLRVKAAFCNSCREDIGLGPATDWEAIRRGVGGRA